MPRRGGRRPRHMPPDVSVFVSSGRWGRRRARVGQCAAVLAAELVYGKLICEGAAIRPGWQATGSWEPHGATGPSWLITFEAFPNAVWRRGRLFLHCPHCHWLATRLYVPVVGLAPRCRTCWGLSYESRSWSYARVGLLGALLGPVAHATTAICRRERKLAAQARYEARRPFLCATTKPCRELQL